LYDSALGENFQLSGRDAATKKLTFGEAMERQQNGQIPDRNRPEAQAEETGRKGCCRKTETHVRVEASPPRPTPGEKPTAVW
jgi:hypothetical protein